MQWTTLGPDICSQVKKLPAKWNVLCQPKDQGALENMIYVHVKNNALLGTWLYKILNEEDFRQTVL